MDQAEQTEEQNPITNLDRPKFLYDWVGSSGDTNTRSFVDELIATGRLEIGYETHIPEGSLPKLRKLAELIGGEVIMIHESNEEQ